MELNLLGHRGKTETMIPNQCRCYDVQFSHQGMIRAQRAVNGYREEVLRAG